MLSTRHNFSEVGPSCIEAISRADFIAVDAEMTGLNARPDLRNSLGNDTIHSRYSLCRQGATANLATQWGIAPFRFDAEKGRWEGKAFAFYAFPEGEDNDFQCNAGSMRFLRQHHFDFKRWVDGVPWLSRLEEARQRRKVEASAEALALRQDAPADVRDERVKAQLQDWRLRIAAWLERMEASHGGAGVEEQPSMEMESTEAQHVASAASAPAASDGAGDVPDWSEITDDDLDGLPALILPESNAFLRKCTHDLVRRELPGCISVKREADKVIGAPRWKGRLRVVLAVPQGVAKGAGTDAFWHAVRTGAVNVVALDAWQEWHKAKRTEARQERLAEAAATAQVITSASATSAAGGDGTSPTASVSAGHPSAGVATGGASGDGYSEEAIPEKEQLGEQPSDPIPQELRALHNPEIELPPLMEPAYAASLREAREQAEVRMQEVEERVGLRKVFDAIRDRGVPVIVHNGMCDLCFAYDAFEGPLPLRAGDFADRIGRLFPTVYDTKLVLRKSEDLKPLLPNTWLGAAHDALKQHYDTARAAGGETGAAGGGGLPAVQLAEGFSFDAEGASDEAEGADAVAGAGASHGGASEHDAGYDAFITGATFARVLGLRGINGAGIRAGAGTGAGTGTGTGTVTGTGTGASHGGASEARAADFALEFGHRVNMMRMRPGAWRLDANVFSSENDGSFEIESGRIATEVGVLHGSASPCGPPDLGPKASTILVSQLNETIKSDTLMNAVAAAAGLDRKSLGGRAVTWLGDDAALVRLPTVEAALAVVRAAATDRAERPGLLAELEGTPREVREGLEAAGARPGEAAPLRSDPWFRPAAQYRGAGMPVPLGALRVEPYAAWARRELGEDCDWEWAGYPYAGGRQVPGGGVTSDDGGEGLGGCADGVAGAKRSSVGMGEAGAGEAAGGGCSPSSKKARQ